MTRYWHSMYRHDALTQGTAVECLRGSDQFAPVAGRPASVRISRKLGNPEAGT